MDKKVEILAKKVRYDILDMLQHRGYGHLGGSLSLVELFAVLYGKQMKYGKRQVICWIENHFKKIDNYIEN